MPAVTSRSPGSQSYPKYSRRPLPTSPGPAFRPARVGVPGLSNRAENGGNSRGLARPMGRRARSRSLRAGHGRICEPGAVGRTHGG